MDGNKNLAVLGDSAMKTVMAGSWIDTSTTRGKTSKSVAHMCPEVDYFKRRVAKPV